MTLDEFKAHLTDMNKALSDHYDDGHIDMIEVNTVEEEDDDIFTYRVDGIVWMVTQFFFDGTVDEWVYGEDDEPHRMNSIQEWKDHYVKEMTGE